MTTLLLATMLYSHMTEFKPKTVVKSAPISFTYVIIGVATVCIIGYFGYRYYLKRDKMSSSISKSTSKYIWSLLKTIK